MQNTSFEQQLKDKANEFTIQPSDNVWNGIATQAGLASATQAFSWIKFSLNILLPAVVMIGSGFGLSTYYGKTNTQKLTKNTDSEFSLNYATTSMENVDVADISSLRESSENSSEMDNSVHEIGSSANVANEKPVVMTALASQGISIASKDRKSSTIHGNVIKSELSNATNQDAKLSIEEQQELELEKVMLSRIKGKRTDFKFNTSAFSKKLEQKQSKRDKWN